MTRLLTVWILLIAAADGAWTQAIGSDAPDKAFLSTRHLPLEVTRLSHLRRGEPKVVLLDWFGVS